MRYVAWGLGALAALVLAVVLVGLALPARHRASRQAVFAAPPDALFALLTDVERFPAWRPSVTRVESLGTAGGRARFREVGTDGAILYEVADAVPGRRLVTRIADPSLPFGGTWTYELTPAARGTTLRITEDGEVRNPVFRFVSRFVMGHTATIDRYLSDLGRRLGEQVAIE